MHGHGFGQDKASHKQKYGGIGKRTQRLGASATPNKTQSTAPMRALTGMGMGSVIHQVTIQSMIAAKVWAWVLKSGMGIQ